MGLTFLCSLGVLGLLKYFDFLLGNVNALLGLAGIAPVSKPFSIGLPVGISFYTFQSLGYMVDVYRGDTKAERNILNYALFVSFFPVILSGPIERSGNLLRQIRELPEKALWNYGRVAGGLTLLLFGLFQKMVIADRIAILANQVFDNYHMYGTFGLTVGAIAYTIQILLRFRQLFHDGPRRGEGAGFWDHRELPDALFLAVHAGVLAQMAHLLKQLVRDYLYIPWAAAAVGNGADISI